MAARVCCREAGALFSQARARISSNSQSIRALDRFQRRYAATQATRFKLNNGAEIPALGIGTWRDPDHQEAAVLHALKKGYRHIDGARVYGTEPAVCRAMRESGVPREDIFLTTKLWNNSHHPDDVEKACDASLIDLGTNYLDLYLMHWPSSFTRSDNLRPTDDNGSVIPGDTDYVDTWKAMEKLQEKGKCRAIGISNFSQAEATRLLEHARIPPAVHQIELHPYLQQRGFMDFHTRHNIHVTQYSPFGNKNDVYSKAQSMSQLIEDPVLVQIGKKHGDKSGAQVALAWGIQSGKSVIPKSKTPSRIDDNYALDFTLDTKDMGKIAGLDRRLRFNDPSSSFKWNFYADLDGKSSG